MIERVVAAAVRVFTGAQARWEGGEPSDAQRVYFANHTSNLDFLAVWSVIPLQCREYVRPVAARDYWSANRCRRYLADRVFRALLIERRDVRKSNNPLEVMLAAVDRGESLIIFPEGGRGREGEMREFKSGIFHLSQKRSHLEFVPTYIHNANRVLPKGEILPIPILCSVTFGAAIQLDAEEGKDQFLTRARNHVQALRVE